MNGGPESGLRAVHLKAVERATGRRGWRVRYARWQMNHNNAKLCFGIDSILHYKF